MITAAFPFRQPTPAEVELAACDLYLKSRANPPNAKIAFIRLPVQASKKKALLSYMKAKPFFLIVDKWSADGVPATAP